MGKRNLRGESIMTTFNLDDFQNQVSDLLIRHRSYLDVSTKFQESNARVNRSISKAVTECGCLQVNAGKQQFSEKNSLETAKATLQTHLSGKLCDPCLDVVSREIGKNLFYLTALCNLLEIPLNEMLRKESEKLSTLGVFNLS